MDKDGWPTPFKGSPGQRVYWHGVFPDPERKGTIKRTGTIRHEVLWDGDTEPSLIQISALQGVRAFPTCCAYCISWKENRRAIRTGRS